MFLLYFFLLQNLIGQSGSPMRSTANCKEFDQHLEGWISQLRHLHFNVSVFVVFLILFLSITEADLDKVAVQDE